MLIKDQWKVSSVYEIDEFAGEGSVGVVQVDVPLDKFGHLFRLFEGNYTRRVARTQRVANFRISHSQIRIGLESNGQQVTLIRPTAQNRRPKVKIFLIYASYIKSLNGKRIESDDPNVNLIVDEQRKPSICWCLVKIFYGWWIDICLNAVSNLIFN